MYIESLFYYPIKSCAGISLQMAELGARGILNDREFMLIDQWGDFITQRDFAALALVQPALQGDVLRVQAPSMGELFISVPSTAAKTRLARVWECTCMALDCGNDAAEWFSSYLNTRCRLVRIPPDFVRPLNPKYSPSATAQTGFSDGYPLLVTSLASLAQLNTQLPQPIPMNRFRPNIVVAGEQPAWDEDHWHILQTAAVRLQVVKPCARCVITTTDQATLQRSPEPLRTLAGYRRHPEFGVIFGQNVVHLSPGVLHVNAEVQLLARQP